MGPYRVGFSGPSHAAKIDPCALPRAAGNFSPATLILFELRIDREEGPRGSCSSDSGSQSTLSPEPDFVSMPIKSARIATMSMDYIYDIGYESDDGEGPASMVAQLGRSVSDIADVRGPHGHRPTAPVAARSQSQRSTAYPGGLSGSNGRYTEADPTARQVINDLSARPPFSADDPWNRMDEHAVAVEKISLVKHEVKIANESIVIAKTRPSHASPKALAAETDKQQPTKRAVIDLPNTRKTSASARTDLKFERDEAKRERDEALVARAAAEEACSLAAAERDQARAELDYANNDLRQANLVREEALAARAMAEERYLEVAVERDQALQKLDQVNLEMDLVHKERDGALEACNTSQQAILTARIDHERGLTDLVAVNRSLELAKKERDEAIAARDAAKAALTKAKRERDIAVAERKQAFAARDDALNSLDSTETARWLACMERDQIHADLRRFQDERDEAQSELGRVIRERDSMKKERDQEKGELEQAKGGQDRAKRERDHAIAERDSLLAEKDETAAKLLANADEIKSLRDKIGAFRSLAGYLKTWVLWLVWVGIHNLGFVDPSIPSPQIQRCPPKSRTLCSGHEGHSAHWNNWNWRSGKCSISRGTPPLCTTSRHCSPDRIGNLPVV